MTFGIIKAESEAGYLNQVEIDYPTRSKDPVASFAYSLIGVSTHEGVALIVDFDGQKLSLIDEKIYIDKDGDKRVNQLWLRSK